MKKITNIRKSVCIMANELKKAGYTLSQAFKKAWRRVKLQMVVKVAGTTFENRQERLQFLKLFQIETLKVESMSEITRKAVKKLGFRNICLSENITADRANFRTIYEQMAENEYTAKQIPLNLSKLIESIQQTEQQKRIRSKDQEKS